MVLRITVEQRDERRHVRCQPGVQAQDFLRHPLESLAPRVSILDLEIVFEEIDDRQVRSVRSIRHRARCQRSPWRAAR